MCTLTVQQSEQFTVPVLCLRVNTHCHIMTLQITASHCSDPWTCSQRQSTADTASRSERARTRTHEHPCFLFPKSLRVQVRRKSSGSHLRLAVSHTRKRSHPNTLTHIKHSKPKALSCSVRAPIAPIAPPCMLTNEDCGVATSRGTAALARLSRFRNIYSHGHTKNSGAKQPPLWEGQTTAT